MRRITATLYGILFIIIVLFMLTQAGDMGVPWLFTLVAVVMIIMIVISLVRTWL